jgi:TetR/AcrR family transcriptional regulator, transcriptional repressor for nem operon
MAKSPEETRKQLLEVAFEEIHLNGFQAASISKILENTQLTKGALYHHFANKTQLGYAVVEDILRPQFIETWVRPLEIEDDAISGIINILMTAKEDMSPEFMNKGCPLNNLIQEMSPIDDGFRLRLQSVVDLWKNTLSASFARSKQKGLLKDNIDPDQAADFVIAVIEGVSSLTKNIQDSSFIESCMPQFIVYLEALRK